MGQALHLGGKPGFPNIGNSGDCMEESLGIWQAIDPTRSVGPLMGCVLREAGKSA